MATVNHVRLARLNPLLARECEGDHEAPPEDFPFWLRPPAVGVDRYTHRSNICPVCHMARALGTGECAC